MLSHFKSLDYCLDTNLYNLCNTFKSYLFLMCEPSIIITSGINFPVHLKRPHALILTYHRNKQSI